MQTIPLKGGAANAHQRFNVQLGESLCAFELDYVSYTDAPAWNLNIRRDGSLMVAGAHLEPGCDIIQNNRAGIGRLVFVGEPVTLNNLGIDNALTWVPTDI
ncbi:MAG: phage baseplate plug family protein [Pyrinomonadaceae bacterium]